MDLLSALTLACAIISFVLISRISNDCEVTTKASGTVITVVSPALTFFPDKSNFALIRNVAHCAKSQVRSPPSLFTTLTSVIASTNFPVTEISGLSANVLFKLNTKTVVNKQIIKEKIPNFFLFFIIFLPFCKIGILKIQKILYFK